MNRLMKSFTAISLSLATTLTFSAPKELITQNDTDFDSNAFVGGVAPSPHPTPAHKEKRVAWPAVRIACFGHVVNGKCWAIIKLDNRIELGKVTIDLESGQITPTQMSNNGYTFTVVGLGKTVISKN